MVCVFLSEKIDFSTVIFFFERLNGDEMYSINDSERPMPHKIKVLVKSSVIPYLSEFAFEVDKQLTIGVLKNWINVIFKGYVNTSEHQLVFCDRIVGNNQEIGQLVEDDSNAITFHLVASSGNPISPLDISDLFMDFSNLVEQNALNNLEKVCSSFHGSVKLPIYYQAAIVNNKPCLLKLSTHSKVYVSSNISFLTESKNAYHIFLMPSENVSRYLNRNSQNDSQFSSSSVNSDLHVQNLGADNERFRITFVHLWLFVRLAFFVGLFSVNSSWIRFCTLVIIALQFFCMSLFLFLVLISAVWHTGRLLSMRLFFQRIINRVEDRYRDSLRNGQASLGSESELSQSTSHDQDNHGNNIEEFDWRRNLGYKILAFIVSLFPLTE
ncbi:hypothetical protein PORY_002292 [Pneumocystis oryctolagi]|uniref:Uncharacterized protein n=1 Tax=Pneumocystis oryctolagi TaxID=42067 RepID=A0ACB7CCU9_9ASCO|nr:hypothetical protein PORY_002292 [Pneumocystis oryctolagi]